MPGYFSRFRVSASHRATLTSSLEALRDELPGDVARHHEQLVRAEVQRLSLALQNIAKGYPCDTAEDMQRVAREALPASAQATPDPATETPETREAFYDAEVAPLLTQLGMQCQARGLSLIAVVDWGDGDVGLTGTVSKTASPQTKWAQMAAMCQRNVDKLIFGLMQYGREHGHSSLCLKLLDVPTTPEAPKPEAAPNDAPGPG